ncbi:MAG: polysaccharide biosynthesis/export family protein [Prevotellaceae bacterium]|jgi:polysaccharide export outer membrane protein|nr:polysaccharide biosynthesis/export family protein [Prevotellaceae bacterium]
MKYLIRLLFIYTCITLLSSCYNYKHIGFLQNDNEELYYSIDYQDYKIRVNDLIIFRLITLDETQEELFSLGFGNGMGMQYTVYADGTIDLPFLEPVHIEGLTATEAELKVEKYYKDVIPDASVKLALYNKTFTVLGDINPGIYPIYKDRMTIFQALAMTGDLILSGDRKNVRIIRETDKGTKILEFDIRPAKIIESEYYYIYPNDIIYVKRENQSFFKSASYGGLLSTITSSINFFMTVVFMTRLSN